jgi:hypothetical protein
VVRPWFARASLDLTIAPSELLPTSQVIELAQLFDGRMAARKLLDLTALSRESAVMKKPALWVGGVCAATVAFALWAGLEPVSSSPSSATGKTAPLHPIALHENAPPAQAVAKPRDRGNYIFRMLQ